MNVCLTALNDCKDVEIYSQKWRKSLHKDSFSWSCLLLVSLQDLNSLLFVIEFKTSLLEKTENDMWVTGCQLPYDKISIKLFKNKYKLSP